MRRFDALKRFKSSCGGSVLTCERLEMKGFEAFFGENSAEWVAFFRFLFKNDSKMFELDLSTI